MEVSGQLHVPAALLPGKHHSIRWIERWLEPGARPGRGGEDKRIPAENRNSVGRPSHSLVTVLKMGIGETRCEGADWIRMVQDSVE